MSSLKNRVICYRDALIRIFKQIVIPPAMTVTNSHLADITGNNPVHAIAEQVFNDYFGHSLIRIGTEFDHGKITPVSEQFLAALKLDKLIRSAFVVQRGYTYIRVSYIDGGHVLYLVPSRVNIEAAL